MTLVDANPDGLHPLPGVVTHVVTVPELGLVYTSGQVAWDKDGNLVGDSDYAKQAEQIVRNLDVALASVGATRADLIKQTIYVVDRRPEIVPVIMGPVHAGTRRGIGVVAARRHGRVRRRSGSQFTKIACSRLVPADRLSRSGISAKPLPLGSRIQKRARGDSVPTITSPAYLAREAAGAT